MTRINTHTPIIDEHLRAARIEYCRIPNSVLKERDAENMYAFMARISKTMPSNYTVRTEANPKGGQGHMTFFFNKIMFVERQYKLVLMECMSRKFKFDSWWPNRVRYDCASMYNDWEPNEADILLCKTRQIERIPKVPHIYGHLVSHSEAEQAIISNQFPSRIKDLIYDT